MLWKQLTTSIKWISECFYHKLADGSCIHACTQEGSFAYFSARLGLSQNSWPHSIIRNWISSSLTNNFYPGPNTPYCGNGHSTRYSANCLAIFPWGIYRILCNEPSFLLVISHVYWSHPTANVLRLVSGPLSQLCWCQYGNFPWWRDMVSSALIDN